MLIDKNTKVLVQGITGKEGRKAAQAMLEYHTQIVGGVTPYKGGEEVAGKPVFNSIKEAQDQLGIINITVVYAPPMAAKEAILEAVNSNIPIINVMTERIPVKDTAYCLAAADEKNIRIIGPSSLGFIIPEVGRIGVIGGPLVCEIFKPGPIGVISRSGGMANEVCWQVRKAGLGQSAAIHIGGDMLIGTAYSEILKMFEHDDQTKAVIIFGEHGGEYEFEIQKLIKKKEFSKPIAIYIGGKFASQLPEGTMIGHAGALVKKGQGAKEKEEALREVGVMIASTYEQLVELVKPFV